MRLGIANNSSLHPSLPKHYIALTELRCHPVFDSLPKMMMYLQNTYGRSSYTSENVFLYTPQKNTHWTFKKKKDSESQAIHYVIAVLEIKLLFYLSVIAVIMLLRPCMKLYICDRLHLEFANNFQVTE